MSRSVFLAASFSILAGACGDNAVPSTEPAPAARVTYWNDIYPVMQNNCNGCHQAGGVAPVTFADFATVKEWGHAIRQRTADRTMPPWGITDDGSCNDFQDSLYLADADIELIGKWVDGGMEEGTPGGVLPIRTVGGLAADAPGVKVVHTPAYTPAPQGPPFAINDEYVCFQVELPRGPGDHFITGSEVLPGNANISHHALFLLVDGPGSSLIPGKSNDQVIAELDALDPRVGWPCFGTAGDGVLHRGLPGGWVPGVGANHLPANTGYRIKPNDRFIVQMHYNMATPGTLGQSDSSEVRVQLADQVEREAQIILSDSFLSSIATPTPAQLEPGKDSVTHSWRLDGATMLSDATGGSVQFSDAMPAIEVYAVQPHMHARGRKMQVSLTQADGSKQCVADVFNWDFHWQRIYHYDGAPLRLAADTQLDVTCDWTTRDATEPVTPGWGTQNEMCLPGLYVSMPVQPSL
jgi:hypothetical protein